MRHTEHNIYINGTTSVSKIINLHNSGVIRVLQTFGLIYIQRESEITLKVNTTGKDSDLVTAFT